MCVCFYLSASTEAWVGRGSTACSFHFGFKALILFVSTVKAEESINGWFEEFFFRTYLVKIKINNSHERHMCTECIKLRNCWKISTERKRCLIKCCIILSCFPQFSVGTLNKAGSQKKRDAPKNTENHTPSKPKGMKNYLSSLQYFCGVFFHWICRIYIRQQDYMSSLWQTTISQKFAQREHARSIHVCCLLMWEKKARSQFPHQETKTGTDLTMR